MEYDTVIIGGGVAGLAAAIYSGRFEMKTLVLGDLIGGTITLTDVVENYPGFEKITGKGLGERIRKHAEGYDIEIKQVKANRVKKRNELYSVETGEGIFNTKTVIFATGTEWRKLEVLGEEKFANRGVHYCAMCDGFFYKNKVIGVVGGSDSAAKEALLLSTYGKKVYIIYRREKIRAEPVNARRVEANKKIEVINNTNIVEIRGDERMTKVIFDRPYKGSREFQLDGLFIEIGHIPLSHLAKELGVELNKKGEIMIDRESKTNLPGVFAAGDVADTKFKQAITGVAEGVTAAYSAYQYIKTPRS